ncbi:hypothetical protein SDC9_112327 [bioreactor metagenome]|uniref:Uncharacterized protein n=1 Tax=bioreactor metagenome TaxID=1076179 RepID=A0A645BLM1_9ZZZZ
MMQAVIRLAIFVTSDLKTDQPITAQFSEQKMSRFMKKNMHVDG